VNKYQHIHPNFIPTTKVSVTTIPGTEWMDRTVLTMAELGWIPYPEKLKSKLKRTKNPL